uniref:Uncharacterized protein n=1 Tax=Salmo trutta TaxID=8032 RepID=A0A673WWS2_SALTR
MACLSLYTCYHGLSLSTHVTMACLSLYTCYHNLSLSLHVTMTCLSLSRDDEDDDIAHQFCCPASECSSPSSR